MENINVAIIINLDTGDGTNKLVQYMEDNFNLDTAHYIINKKDGTLGAGSLKEYGTISMEDTMENLFIETAEEGNTNFIRIWMPIGDGDCDHILTIKTNFHDMDGTLPESLEPYKYI